jgi:hypothetical protein
MCGESWLTVVARVSSRRALKFAGGGGVAAPPFGETSTVAVLGAVAKSLFPT